MNTPGIQLELFHRLSLNPTHEVKRLMRLSVSRSRFSREEIVDQMNKITVQEGMRATISKHTLDNWLKESDQGRMPSPAWMTIFCYVLHDSGPISAMLRPLECAVLGQEQIKLLAWAQAEQEKMSILKYLQTRHIKKRSLP